MNHNKPSKTQRRTTYRALLTALILLLCLLTPLVTKADKLNGRILTSHKRINELLLSTQLTECTRGTCRLDFNPLPVTLSSPRGTRIRLVLQSAHISIPESLDPNAAATRPILLKGVTLHSSLPNSQGATPVAATIFRDTDQPTIELAVASPSRLTLVGSSHLPTLTVFRAHLTALTKRSRSNSRVNSPSSYAFGTRRCAADRPTSNTGVKRAPIVSQSVGSLANYKVLYLATDYDSQFATKVGCASQRACNNKLLSAAHSASVFYEAQLGYSLEVVRQFGPSNPSRSTASATLLDAFQELVRRERLTFMHTGTNPAEDQFDMIQFFTGRTMDDDVIGVAYVGTVCQNRQTTFASSVIQHTSDTLNPVTSAHEIGHTLSASHVSSGIMRASLGRSPPQSFASESVNQITSYLSQWYGECRQGTNSGVRPPAATPTPAPTPTPTRIGGGGSASDPSRYVGVPVTASIAIRSHTRSLTLSTKVSSITPGCSVIIRAAQTSLATLTAPAVTAFTPTEQTTLTTASVANRVRPAKDTGANLFFLAEYSCQDGSVKEVSRTIAYNPNRIRKLSSPPISKRTWLKRLSDAFKQT